MNNNAGVGSREPGEGFLDEKNPTPAPRLPHPAFRLGSRGITLMELLLVVAILAVVALVGSRFLMSNISFFQRTRVRQQVQRDSRICMDTIVERLRNGKAKSLVITTPPPGPPTVAPNSAAEFDLQNKMPSGAVHYAIFLNSSGEVRTKERLADGTWQPERLLASHVSFLMFTGSNNDPGTVNVTVRFDAPWDQTHDPSRMSSLLMSNQTVQMVNSQ